MRRSATAFLLLVLAALPTRAADGNRLAYLDEDSPYYVGRTFPKLVTPQWVGEDGVEAVVILAIDDMRDPQKYETFLRPILRRLQQIDGRAPVSIMSNKLDPSDPRLQTFLKEGLSLETHTLDHPCPLLAKGDFAKAKANYDGCIDLLGSVPGNRPVAFRMPCCDSLNTPSPRFWAEMFNKTTEKGNFLQVDSSVFNVFTSDDPELPRDLVLDADGRDRFRKYIPYDRSFVNTVEDYPYPYVIGHLCWEFPCVTPSDWQANHLHEPNNPVTVRDWQAALDATVRKQGVFTMVFHPHGWIKNEQLVDLIDYAVRTHGKKVKFLTFKEALERLDKNLLGGQPLRDPKTGADNGVRLLDVNNDGFLDAVIGNDDLRQTRLWSPKTRSWALADFPAEFVREATRRGKEQRVDAGLHFGVLRGDGQATLLPPPSQHTAGWHFHDGHWVEDPDLHNGLGALLSPYADGPPGDRGLRLRDLDGDGRCELIVSSPQFQAVFAWSPEEKSWHKLPFKLPGNVSLVAGHDPGLRFLDLDGDGDADVVVSNEKGYAVYLFTSMQEGWSRKVLSGRPGDTHALPLISRDGVNNGAWFRDGHLYVVNENTDLLPGHVESRSFNDLLAGVEPTARGPEASRRSIRTRPGFEVELVAAEPLVQDPIVVAWGPDGKLWVVEMGDYPLGTDGKGAPGGRIKFLESTHNDGKYDKATLFLDGLHYPTGVLPWRKGVIITCAPEIFYAEDTDGDGKADLHVTLYSGFQPGNPQHRINGLVWGLDNWLYCANGDSGGVVRSVKTGATVDMRGRDLRIRPDDGALDAETGQSQFGRCRDDWGNWFGCNNSNPMYQYVLSDHYLRRNPHVPPPELRVPVSVTPGAARVYPLSRTLPRFNDPAAANHFTSACSVIVYRDELFGPAFAGNSFVSEPVHNLVHREIMPPTGVTFTSRRAPDEQESEFWASTDNWTRPTTIQTGPDGALWIVDMYRAVIEHPEWIPPDWQKRLDLRAGSDLGRIYRVYPVGTKPRAIPRLDKLDTAGLVAALDSPSGWQRDTAQQMLLWRNDKAAVPLLEKQATESKRPLCRLHSLCTLDGLGELKPEVVRRALADAHPGVRRHAVRLCEGRLANAPALGTALLQRVGDADAQVRLQLACTLGEWDDPRAGQALAELALRDAGDRYLLAAVLGSVNRKNLTPMLLAVLGAGQRDPAVTPPAGLVENLLRMATALGDRKATVSLLQAVATPEKGRHAVWQLSALAGLLDTLGQRGTTLAKLQAEGDTDMKAAVQRLAGLFAAARTLAGDEKAPVPERVAAVRLLGRGLDRPQEDVKLLADLLVPQTPEDLQGAAVATLGVLRDPRVPEVLLRGWKAYSPSLRGRVLDALLGREDWAASLLDAVEHKQVLIQEIDAAHRQRLLQHRLVGIRERSAKVLAGAVDADRQKVVAAYRPALALAGDVARGRQLFGKTCATCHQLGGLGQEVGPDLASVGDKSPEGLLISILDPNRAVEARYLSYVALLKDGRTFTGLLAGETGSSITLVGTDGKKQVVLRTDLDELSGTGKSLMPEGIEKDLKPQDLADLIAFVRSASPALRPKTFEGNHPEVVHAAGDGSLRLPASSAEIYGSTLVLEKQYGNLGYWSSPDDQAAWAVEVTRPGRYAVWFDYACENGAAGNAYELRGGDSRLTGKVAGTGTWDDYKQERIGEVTLASGRQQVVLRGVGKIKGALIDLKGIRLVPVGSD
jgi:putative membrane-bound dehydrogenase-like protein